MTRKRHNHKPTIQCLECGKRFVRPLSHVWQVHGLSAREYKELHGLDVKKGIASEAYKEIMREHTNANRAKVIEQNLLKHGKRSRFKKGDQSLGKYERSEQTKKRLATHWIKTQPKGPKWKKERANWQAEPCATCGEAVQRSDAHRAKFKNVYCSRRCATIARNKARKKD